MFSLVAQLCLLLFWTKGARALDPDMPFMEYLDNDRLVCLTWGFDEVEGIIKFKFAVNSTGWISFGLSPNGGMKGSDMVIGGLGSNGIYFTDRHATGNLMPLVDEEQSYTLLSLSEKEGQTIMTFQRLIKACDDQDFHITAQPIKVIYAYGTTDEIKYHGSRRGTKELNLLNYMPRTSQPNSSYFSVKVDKITIPPVKTYYHCKLMNFPTLETKHHIYKIEPDIEHLDIVHHMLLYHCPPFVTGTYDEPCYLGSIGDACFGVVASWGTGGGIFELPENAGLPFGGNKNDTYRLEIHYNNPEGKAGITDSSGLRLYYTDQLREHDAGILMTGLVPRKTARFNIPPRADSFRIYGICDTAYYSQFVNQWSDLHVFGVLLHTHLAGRKVRVGHFRNGKQMDFLGLDENYDFDFQQIVNFGKIKTVKQGDEIAVECAYNTSNRTGITAFGLATTDEMCLAFLYYYPRNIVVSCCSEPDTTHVTKPRNSTYEQPTASDDTAAYENQLKTAPQILQIIDDYFNYRFIPNGTVKDLMETPTPQCEKTNPASGNCSEVKPFGMLILLLWIVIF